MTEKLLAKVYQFIKQYTEYAGVSPTLREIADGCHITLGSVLDALWLLEARGWIERDEEARWSIHLPSHAAE
jgi:SOS-response transcriptional repressor LexA